MLIVAPEIKSFVFYVSSNNKFKKKNTKVDSFLFPKIVPNNHKIEKGKYVNS